MTRLGDVCRVWPPLGRVKNVRQLCKAPRAFPRTMAACSVGEEAGRERGGIYTTELYIQGGRQGLSRRKRRDDGPVLRTICGHRVEEHAHTLQMRLIMIYEVEMPMSHFIISRDKRTKVFLHF